MRYLKDILGFVLAMGAAAILAVVCVFICMVGFAYISSGDSEKYIVDSTWVPVIGQLTQTDHGGEGSASKFSYIYNGHPYSEYSLRDFHVHGNVIGEKYVLLVNKKYPDKYVPVAWKPLFELYEERDTVSGTIENIDWDQSSINEDSLRYKGGISYVYIVNNRKYEHGQMLSPRIKKMHPSLNIATTASVIYLKNDPQRSMMIFD